MLQDPVYGGFKALSHLEVASRSDKAALGILVMLLECLKRAPSPQQFSIVLNLASATEYGGVIEQVVPSQAWCRVYSR